MLTFETPQKTSWSLFLIFLWRWNLLDLFSKKLIQESFAASVCVKNVPEEERRGRSHASENGRGHVQLDKSRRKPSREEGDTEDEIMEESRMGGGESEACE